MSSDLKNTQEVEAVAEGNSLFSAYLHEELKTAHPDNLIFSPLSLSAVTAMVKIGARGKTADEIRSVFNFPSSNEALGNGYSQVLSTLKESTEGYTLCQANKLHCGLGYGIKPEYIASVVKSFDAGIEEVDFSKQVATATTINNWVADFTNNKISELIDPDSLDGLTAMLLINGVYFKVVVAAPLAPAAQPAAIGVVNQPAVPPRVPTPVPDWANGEGDEMAELDMAQM